MLGVSWCNGVVCLWRFSADRCRRDQWAESQNADSQHPVSLLNPYVSCLATAWSVFRGITAARKKDSSFISLSSVPPFSPPCQRSLAWHGLTRLTSEQAGAGFFVQGKFVFVLYVEEHSILFCSVVKGVQLVVIFVRSWKYRACPCLFWSSLNK